MWYFITQKCIHIQSHFTWTQWKNLIVSLHNLSYRSLTSWNTRSHHFCDLVANTLRKCWNNHNFVDTISDGVSRWKSQANVNSTLPTFLNLNRFDEVRLQGALQIVLNAYGKRFKMKNDNVVPVAYIATRESFVQWNKWFAFIVMLREKKKYYIANRFHSLFFF